MAPHHNKGRSVHNATDNAADEGAMTVHQGANRASEGADAAANATKDFTAILFSPERRQQIWEESKQSPLFYSLALIQLLVSSMPLTGFGLFMAAGAALTIGTSLAIFSGFLFVGLAFLVPILAVTIPTAAVIWLVVVVSAFVSDWFYNQVYSGSALQANVQQLSHEASETVREIEQNASNEYNGYKHGAQDRGQQIRQRAEEVYSDTQNSLTQAKENAMNNAYQAKDNAMNSASQTADQVKHDASQAKDNATQSNGIVGALLQDDGIIDGLNTKKDRVADRMSKNANAAETKVNSKYAEMK